MRRFVALALALALAPVFAVLPSIVHAQSRDVRADSVVARVDRVFAKWDHVNSPGCAVGVSQDGKLVYQRGYGMSNLEHAIAITPQSIFHVASISKQFTAFAILLLEQDGKLSVTDDVRKYVPELPSYGHPITIDHLLHHTSGLRDQWSLLGLADWRDDDLITEADVMRVVTRQKALNFEPGEEYLYSNTGFTLLAVIVKRVSGQSLRAFADERIFKPLGMTHTHFHDDHTMIVPGRTQAYGPRPGGDWKISIPVFDTYGATSLFTTVGDLLRWEQNFGDATVGGGPLIARLTTPGALNDGAPITYGRGVVATSYRGLRTVGHGGADAGYRADVVRFPDQGLAVAAMCNLANINPSSLTRQVAEVFVGDLMQPAAAVTASNGASTIPRLDSAQAARYTGAYWNSRTEDVARVTAKDGRLTIARGATLPLVATGPDRFAVEGQPVTVEFVVPAKGARQMRVLPEGQRPQLFEAAEALAPGAAPVAPFAGRYGADEIDTRVELRVRGDSLFAQSRRGTEFALERLSPDLFQADFGTLRFVRDAKGSPIAFLVSTGRVRRLRFDRLGAR